MSPRKSERLVNLLIALLSTRRYLTKHELRDIIEDYRGTSDAAFDRQFDRDKQELRRLGIEIEVGSNDPYFDEEEGYRVNRASFELPEISFTADELAALALAGQVWQDTLAADHTAQAFEALRAGGAAPDPSLVPSVRPRLDAREPDFDVVYDAVVRHVQLTFGYANRPRKLQPWMLLQRRGRWYVYGFDLDRSADRFFKLARFTAPAAQFGKADAFQVPADARERSTRLVPTDSAVALLAVRDDALVPTGAEPASDKEAPHGYSTWWLRAVNEETLVREVVAGGADFLLLDPPQLRVKVVAALEEAAA